MIMREPSFKNSLMASLVLAIVVSMPASAQMSDRQAMMDLVLQVQQLQDEVRMLRGMVALESLLSRRREHTPYCFGDGPGWADCFLVPQLRKSVDRYQLDISDYPLAKVPGKMSWLQSSRVFGGMPRSTSGSSPAPTTRVPPSEQRSALS